MMKTFAAGVSCAVLLGLLILPPAAAKVEVQSLTHSPENPTPDDEVTITIQLDDSTTVNRTFVAWCQSDPELCFTPVQMRYIGAGAYAQNIGKFPDGQEIKYNVTIVYKDGNTSVTEDRHFKVERQHGGNGGNGDNNTNNQTNTTGDGSTGRSLADYLPYIAVAVVVVAVVAVAFALARRKRPGSP